MLTLKTSVAAAICIGVVAATAAGTYVATRTTVAMSCPAPTPASQTPSGGSALPPGNPVHPYHGTQW
jgi:hypothetical protein